MADGPLDKIDKLRGVIVENYNYITGGKARWQVRPLRSTEASKEGLLKSDYSTTNPYSLSMGCIELTRGKRSEPVVRDINHWDLSGTVFSQDIAQGNLHYLDPGSKRQIQVWGILSLLGIVFPPSIEKLQLFNGLIMIGQLIFRGMPKDEMGGGFAGFGRGQGGTHKKVAYLLGVSIWISSKIVIASLLPAAAQGQRWTPILKFCMENGVFAVASMYLQPYKG